MEEESQDRDGFRPVIRMWQTGNIVLGSDSFRDGKAQDHFASNRGVVEALSHGLETDRQRWSATIAARWRWGGPGTPGSLGHPVVQECGTQACAPHAASVGDGQCARQCLRFTLHAVYSAGDHAGTRMFGRVWRGPRHRTGFQEWASARLRAIHRRIPLSAPRRSSGVSRGSVIPQMASFTELS
jgi:hypothetical protein